MFNQAELSASFAVRAIVAADAFVSTRDGHASAKGGLAQRIAEAVVARLLASDEESVQGASRWVGDAIPKDHGAKASSNAYRSAMVWRLDTATVAGLRAMVTPEAATNREAFEVIAIAAAETLGNYWADYKADKKAAKDAAPAKAEGFTGKTVAAPEAAEAAEAAPKVDPTMVALTAALDAIAALKAARATDALTMIAEALAEAAEVVEVAA